MQRKKNIFPYYLVYPLSLANNQKKLLHDFYLKSYARYANYQNYLQIVVENWSGFENRINVYELKGVPDCSIFHIFIQSIRICVHKSPKINFVDNLKRRKSASEIMNFLLR